MVAPGGIRTWARRGRKLLLGILLAVVLIVAGVAISFLLAPTRGLWLQAGLRLAAGSLPGELQGQWAWPRLGRIEGHDLVWTVPHESGTGADTLAVIGSVSLEVDLDALRDHRLQVTDLGLAAGLVDVPLILAMTAPADTMAASAAGADSAAAIPFLHEGSMPGLPSVQVSGIDLAVRRLILPGGLRVADLALTGGGTMARGQQPAANLNHLGGTASSHRAPAWSAHLEHLEARAGFDPATGTVTLDTLSASLPAAGVQADSLDLAMGPLALDGSGRWDGQNWQADLQLLFHTRVPRPWQSPVAGVRVPEAGGRLALRASGDDQEVRAERVDLDLDPGVSLKRGRLVASGRAPLAFDPARMEVAVDTLDLQWDRTTLAGGGRYGQDQVRASLQLTLPDLDLVHLLAPDLLPGVTGHLELAADVQGPLDNPDFTAGIRAGAEAAALWDLPGLAAMAGSTPPDSLVRDLTRQAAVDLTADLAGNLDQLALGLRLDLARTPWLDQGLVSGRAVVLPRRQTWARVELDTLALGLMQAQVMAQGSADTTRAAVEVSLGAGSGELLHFLVPEALPGAELELGGEVAVAGPWHALAGQGRLGGKLLSADLQLPEFSASFRGTAEDLAAELAAGGGIRLGATQLDSLRFHWEGQADPEASLPPGRFTLAAWSPRASLSLQGSARGDTVRTAILDSLRFEAADQVLALARPLTLQQGPGPRDLKVEGLSLRGDLGSLDMSGTYTGLGLDARAATDLYLPREWLETIFPSPVWSAGGGTDVALAGNLVLSTLALAENLEPTFRGDARLSLVPRNEDPPARLDMEFRLAEGDTSGLLADLKLGVGETRLVGGSLLWPGRIDPATRRWRPDGNATGGIDIPEQDLPLDYLNRFLPPEISLGGRLSVAAGLALAAADTLQGQEAVAGSEVSGLARASDLMVYLPNNSRVRLNGEVGLGGKLRDPRLEGHVTVSNGLYRLPEIQRSLHPITGRSDLWTAAITAAELEAAATDSVAPVLWLEDTPLVSPSPPYIPDLDLTITLPGNFLITGYGLDIELAGELKVTRGQDEEGRPAPAVNGRIHIVEGNLNALNHIFEVERGEFDLMGRVPANPNINLKMVTQVEDTEIRILVTGTALDPKVDLESEPQMIQADIMAVLLFGRPINDLDNDQRGSMEQEQTPAQQLMHNLQGVALIFGTAGLQNRMSERLGIDQMGFGSDTEGGGRLVLGKFINPKLLLKYQLSLERSGTYLMTLEYSLSQAFKLISSYGQGEDASGLELRWLRRY
jgi:hypothetical protein